VLRVPSGVVVEKPVVILHWIDAEGGAVFPHTVVQAGEASQVTVVEVLASPEDVRALVAPVVALDAHPAANLRYLNVQQFGSRVWQFAYQGSHVDRDATLHSSMVALGGEYARVRADSRLVGQGATSNLLAVYFGDGRQMHDFRTMQDHDAPKTTSDLLFKGAVEDSAESVYTGLIRVKKGAAGTRAFQTNRNLVLSDGAAANSVPNLEIEENDVSCSHASAVGPIDEEQRYYLEARGIPTEVAERLIVLGFFDDVLARLPVEGLQQPLRAAVATKLDGLRR
jgi:Fe-S cluster assembly protein SufD